MMVIVITFSHHQPVKLKKVLWCIIGWIINMTIFVRKPVNDHTVKRPHSKMQRQQQEEPERRRQLNIQISIKADPQYPWQPEISPVIEPFPFRYIFSKPCFYRITAFENIYINIFCSPHHGKKVFIIRRWMRIPGCICIRMVHAVHDAISFGTKIRWTLRDICQNKKNFSQPGLILNAWCAA